LSAADEAEYGTALREKLSGAYDYDVVPAAAWALLFAWYGGGPAVRRVAIEEGGGRTQQQQVRVETYPIHVHAQVTNERGEINSTAEEELVLSKRTSVAQAKQRLCTHWAVADTAKARLWNVS
jgi:hypothetical protein